MTYRNDMLYRKTFLTCGTAFSIAIFIQHRDK